MAKNEIEFSANQREKLSKLLCNAHSISTEAACFEDATYARQLKMEAEYLIANGVTFATDNNVGSKWIPVAERLPEKAADYLCRCIVNNYDNMPFYMVLRYILVDTNPHFQHETKGGMKVTHWMPLPEPPKGE